MYRFLDPFGISYHVTSLPQQEPEEELKKLLLTKMAPASGKPRPWAFHRLIAGR